MCVKNVISVLLQLIVAGTKDKKKCSAPQQPTEAVKQSSVPHMTTSSGARYALSDKASFKGSHTVDDKTEDQGVCTKYCSLWIIITVCVHTYYMYVCTCSTILQRPQGEILYLRIILQ